MFYIIFVFFFVRRSFLYSNYRYISRWFTKYTHALCNVFSSSALSFSHSNWSKPGPIMGCSNQSRSNRSSPFPLDFFAHISYCSRLCAYELRCVYSLRPSQSTHVHLILIIFIFLVNMYGIHWFVSYTSYYLDADTISNSETRERTHGCKIESFFGWVCLNAATAMDLCAPVTNSYDISFFSTSLSLSHQTQNRSNFPMALIARTVSYEFVKRASNSSVCVCVVIFWFERKLQFICVVKVHNNAKRLHRTTTYHNHNKNCSSTLVHTRSAAHFARSVSVCHCNIIRNLLVVCWFFGVRVCSRFVIVGAALELFMPKKATLVPPKTKMKLLLYCNDVTEFSFFLCCYSSVCMFFSDYNCKIIVSFENRKFKICETKERF